MPQTYTTRQFQAGNSQAVRLPASMAFPAKTELIVTREGDKIVVQPMQKTLENVPQLFSSLKKHALDAGGMVRPEFIDAERDWGNNGSKA
jgi:antitoxin VapB